MIDKLQDIESFHAKGIYSGAIWQGRHFTRFLIQYVTGGRFILLAFGESLPRGWNNFLVHHAEGGQCEFNQQELLVLLESFGAKQLRETVDLVPCWDTYEEEQAKKGNDSP